MIRVILGVAALAVAIPASSADINLIAPPIQGPMWGAKRVRVAFHDGRGIAVWKLGDRSIWAVPLDGSGRPTDSARVIVVDQAGVSNYWVEEVRGSFILWWTAGLSTTRFAPLDEEGNAGPITTMFLSTGPPLAANQQLVLTAAGPFVEFLDPQFAAARSVPLVNAKSIDDYDAAVLNDGSFALATMQADGVYLRRFSPAGEPIEPLLIDSGTSTAGAIATDGESILLTWVSRSTGRPDQVKIALIRPDGSLAIQHFSDAEWSTVIEIQALWAGDRYEVIYTARNAGGHDIDIFAREVTREGAIVLIPPAWLVRNPADEQTLIDAFWSENRLLLFFQEGFGSNDIGPAYVVADGQTTLVSIGPALQDRVDVATADDAWLAAWVEQTSTASYLRVAPLHRDGSAAGPAVTISSTVVYDSKPVVTFNGVDFVVAWYEPFTLLAKRVRRDGTVIDEDPIVIGSTGGWPPAVASRPGVTAATFMEQGELHSVLLHPDGELSNRRRLSRDDDSMWFSAGRPVIAPDEDGFVVVWSAQDLTRPCFPPCHYPTWSEMRLLDSAGALRSGIVPLGEGSVMAVAATADSYAVLFDNWGAFTLRVIDAEGNNLSMTDQIQFDRSAGVGLIARDGEFLLTYELDGVRLLRRITSSGRLLRPTRLDAFAVPKAMNESGSLLAYGSLSRAAATQVIEVPSPLPARRRATRR
jgi:hypothetical protein